LCTHFYFYLFYGILCTLVKCVQYQLGIWCNIRLQYIYTCVCVYGIIYIFYINVIWIGNEFTSGGECPVVIYIYIYYIRILEKKIISYRFLFARFPSLDVRIFRSELRDRNFYSLPAHTLFWSYFPDEISRVISSHPPECFPRIFLSLYQSVSLSISLSSAFVQSTY